VPILESGQRALREGFVKRDPCAQIIPVGADRGESPQPEGPTWTSEVMIDFSGPQSGSCSTYGRASSGQILTTIKT
jgi:hypothetical protein